MKSSSEERLEPNSEVVRNRGKPRRPRGLIFSDATRKVSNLHLHLHVQCANLLAPPTKETCVEGVKRFWDIEWKWLFEKHIDVSNQVAHSMKALNHQLRGSYTLSHRPYKTTI